MKIKKILTLLGAALLPLSPAFGQGRADEAALTSVLRAIEANNPQLQANAQLTHAQKLSVRTDNNLPDPTLSYAHLWNSKDKNVTVGELVVAQRFNFPTLYASRAKLNRLQSDAFDAEAGVMRQELLLQAKEICLDLILLRRQQQLLDERRSAAEELSALYARRLETGEASALETNKLNLELLNVRTETTLNASALRNKLQALTALNGNRPVDFSATTYPAILLPADEGAMLAAADLRLQTLAHQSLAAHQQVAVSRQNWLPDLELGYRRNTESGHPSNGVVVGFSFPLFQNRNKVKVARAQASSLDFQKASAATQTSSALAQLWDEAQSLRTAMAQYERTFAAQQDIALLKQALAGGQISLIAYFVELSAVYQSQQNYLLLENQYQKAVARMYKSRL
ncbi:MAG: TolC family protein [Bacteroides sp.]